MLRDAGADAGARLSFYAADLERDDGWAEAVAGCDYVMHVASPMPPTAPKTEDELIVPARDGALRVLKAARDAKVKRVVLTSTCGAIYYGHPPQKAPFDEASWTNIHGEMSAYVRSKAIAERAPRAPTPVNASANWAAVCQRSAGSFSSALATAASTWGGIDLRCSVSRRGSSDITFLKTVCTVAQVNGGWPASISYRTTPRA
jgi:NAD-dependent epimerase/dehydratase family protein